MNIIDIIILSLLFSGGITGGHNGFFKQTVMLIGTIISFIFAWIFKDYIANFLSYNLPFFKFNGLTALNIVMYQLIAYLVLLFFFIAVVIVLVKITNVFEKILKFTIILGIPSKILGFIVGVIESYVLVFAVLFFLKQPAFDIKPLENSKLTPVIINSSPVLSNIVNDMNESIHDIYNITKNYNKEETLKTNEEIISILLKNNVITEEYIEKLQEKGKI